MMNEPSKLDLEHEDLAAIQAGIEDMKAGHYRSFKEIDAEFRHRHKIARNAENIADSDVVL